MKRIMALTAIVSVLTMFALTSQASAQTLGQLTSDPVTVPEAGTYTFTVTGSGFVPNSSGVNVLTCVVPGPELTPASTAEEIGAGIAMINALGGDCDLGNRKPVSPDGDGGFTAEITADVGPNFALVAGDAAQTQTGFHLVFIVDDMGDDMVPEGAAETGFGGMAGSDGNSVAVPLAATLAAVVLLGGAALVTRRHA